MKPFQCDHCGSLAFFESVNCATCNHTLGFLPDVLELSALRPAGPSRYVALSAAAKGRLYRPCANGRQHVVCNWLVPDEEPHPCCAACRLNLRTPNLAHPGNHRRWHRAELAKRRLLYTLFQLGLPVDGVAAEKRPALRFEFAEDPPDGPPLVTGYAHGLIKFNLAESDDDQREHRHMTRQEPCRTLIGHFRYETAHYYWDRLIADSPWQDEFRERFGGESTTYWLALHTHYQDGPPPDWHLRAVSAYAGTHPWEDWAETWEHYLGMIDTLETAAGYRLSLPREGPVSRRRTARLTKLRPGDTDFDLMLETWFRLTSALNSLNRGMGLPDLYPFELSPPGIERLRFVHDVVTAQRQQSPRVPSLLHEIPDADWAAERPTP